jgi:NAD(P)-dependent dehydrogenase (short-subunit alcohol dehydrogenase family)
MADGASKTILITGATQGLGRALALELAPGNTLLLHGRDAERLADVADEARNAGAEVRGFVADLGDLDQVVELGERIRADEPRLDVLVNNAGLGRGGDVERRETSAQGHELRFAVNVLAPCVLTRELLPLLVESAPARIVNVASAGQQAIDFDDVMLEAAYDGARAYRQSKLAMVMWTFDLAEALRNFGVTANALHPATRMDTAMVRDSGLEPTDPLEEGVRATARLALDPTLEGVSGTYFERLAEATADPQAYDRAARGRLKALVGALAPPPD